MSIKSEIIESIKSRGMKVTPQRIAVMEFLAKSKEHPTAEVIRASLEKTFPSLSVATIYNTLEMLADTGQVMKLKISDDNKVNYDYNTEPHHHFYCKECGSVLDVDIPCSIAATRQVDGHYVEEVHGYFKGICKQCRID